MRVTVVPASPKTGAATVRALLAHPTPGLEVDAFYRDITRVPAEFKEHARFRALQGDVHDVDSLDFMGSDAVLAITPPAYESTEPLAQAELASKNVKQAVEESGTVKRLVLLSSTGAQFSEGVGEIRSNNIAEKVLSTTDVPEVILVRCAYFMENWTSYPETLKAADPFFFSTITPLDWRVPMVAVKDIGATLAKELVREREDRPSPYIFELHGPREYNTRDVQAALSTASERPVDVRPVERGELREHFAKVFPPPAVDLWEEMALSFLPGGMIAPDQTDYDGREIVRGETELLEALGEAVDVLMGRETLRSLAQKGGGV